MQIYPEVEYLLIEWGENCARYFALFNIRFPYIIRENGKKKENVTCQENPISQKFSENIL